MTEGGKRRAERGAGRRKPLPQRLSQELQNRLGAQLFAAKGRVALQARLAGRLALQMRTGARERISARIIHTPV